MKLNKNIKIFINYFLGPLLFVWLSYSIWRQVIRQPNLEQSWHEIRRSFNSPLIWNLFFVVLLMIVNWAIEAQKWKLSVQKIQRLNFLTAFKAVLSGLSFSVTTPNRIGEYLGRVLYMEEGNRIKAVSLTIVCSMSQLIITLFMGLAGLVITDAEVIEANRIECVAIAVVERAVAIAIPGDVGVTVNVAAHDAPRLASEIDAVRTHARNVLGLGGMDDERLLAHYEPGSELQRPRGWLFGDEGESQIVIIGKGGRPLTTIGSPGNGNITVL